ncbi:rhomboid family intramembrane serine protease [Lutibacter sp. HS1-25]|uniref:rhomboid family intramembrane serine protease n=1 Tax=Lutibacter sp. HS1-25 TaxID=2485000 RepID=UPI0010111AF5|nr:rhomboid family intramembrane serine protease [Lutibacter sp. HS1-25]RXP54517.1 rhomboid family intramembrane serine protease [Lutibacter sp. HS1-25]
MTRERQLEYCKVCKNQKFEINQGIICNLTNQKADFENECKKFEIDEQKVETNKEKGENEKKSRFAYGFSPKQIDDISVPNLTKQEAFIFAYETAKKLKWNIGFISESGFIAYTKYSMSSWSEEVQIKIEVGNINIKSECTGSQLIDWGKNRKNIDEFTSTFKQLEINNDILDLENEYEKISKGFVKKEDDIISSPLSKKEKISGIFSLLTPQDGYFVTPILININILIFAIMVISGVHFIMPTSESLLLWGANFRPLSIEGEWWRLLTSMFLHIGIFHLLMNMYALAYIGLLLEPYLGKSRFLSAYILSGIAGSVASLYWNELTISAGASGAIFGMYGLFLAMLSTNLIEKSARKSLLTSIGVFVVYNLVNGINGDIDNAAHIGGLISGAIIGYSFYPSLVKPNPKLKRNTIGLLTILTILTSFTILENTTSDIGKYEKDMALFVKLEEKALALYQLPQNSTNQQILEEIQINGLKSWEESLKLIEKVDTYELPDIIHQRNAKLKEYCELRIKSFEAIVKSITEDTSEFDDEISNYNIQIEQIINELTQSN